MRETSLPITSRGYVSILGSGVGLREVPSLVGPSALGPGHPRARDQADQRMGIIAEGSQTLAVPLNPRVTP